MAIDRKKNLEELRKRALKRSISFASTSKTKDEIKVEADFFKIIENQLYNQIARE